MLLLRADASAAIGTGHVMRCLAIAQAWQDAGGRTVFVCSSLPEGLRPRLLAESCEIVDLHAEAGSKQDALEVLRLADANGAAWIVADGYAFDAQYQDAFRGHGQKLLFIDDYGHAAHYAAELVLNPNVHATPDVYRTRESCTRLLLGPKYALLRREFAAWRNWKREIVLAAKRVLVTMGGSDPDNVTARVLETLIPMHGLECTIVVGAGNQRVAPLRQRAATATHVQFVENATNMPELMAKADIAVSAAGGTTAEAALLGVPMLLVALAPNQEQVAAALDARGAAIDLGKGTALSPARLAEELTGLLADAPRRRDMSNRARTLVDGRGAARAVHAMRWHGLQLRSATDSDARTLWELANEPVVRANSFSPESISWDTHTAWFETKLRDQNCHILMAEDSGNFIGQARLEVWPSGEAEIGVSLVSARRRQGLGGYLIERAVERCSETTKLHTVHAFIRPENLSSQRVFESAGFLREGEREIKGQKALHFVYRSDTQAAVDAAKARRQ